MNSALFVCHGNIIRSPMAAALFKQYISEMGQHEISISSAGLHANRARGADPRALIVAREFGIELRDHQSRPITKEMVETADAIFVMDYLNEAKLLARYPKAKNKIYVLSVFSNRLAEIVDPYHGNINDIRRCYETLRSYVHSLAHTTFPSDDDLKKSARKQKACPRNQA